MVLGGISTMILYLMFDVHQTSYTYLKKPKLELHLHHFVDTWHFLHPSDRDYTFF